MMDTVYIWCGSYISEGGKGIYVFPFYPDYGRVGKPVLSFPAADPSFLALSPDKGTLCAVLEGGEPSVDCNSAVRIFSVRKTDDLEEYPVLVPEDLFFGRGSGPCHCAFSPSFTSSGAVWAANYGDGTIARFSIENRQLSGTGIMTFRMSGRKGPDSCRQEGPHAHSVNPVPGTGDIIAADLGTDSLYLFNEDSCSDYPLDIISLPPGTGPRHVAFHPGGICVYVTGELSNTVEILEKTESVSDGKSGWIHAESLPCVSASSDGIRNYPSHVAISEDGNYLYAANRGNDSITVFSISSDGKDLSLIYEVPTGGIWPRHFILCSGYLLCANQRSGNVSIFRVDSETGFPELVGCPVDVPGAACLCS